MSPNHGDKVLNQTQNVTHFIQGVNVSILSKVLFCLLLFADTSAAICLVICSLCQCNIFVAIFQRSHLIYGGVIHHKAKICIYNKKLE